MPRHFGYNISDKLIPLRGQEVDDRNELIDIQDDKKIRALVKLEDNLTNLARIRKTYVEERDEHAAQAARLVEEIAHVDALILATDQQIDKELRK